MTGSSAHGARPATAGRAPSGISEGTYMDGPLLQLRDIGKNFGPVQALSGIDLDIPAGQVTALVGDNGAGKSTLSRPSRGSGSPRTDRSSGGGSRWTSAPRGTHRRRHRHRLPGPGPLRQSGHRGEHAPRSRDPAASAAGRGDHGADGQEDPQRPEGGHGPDHPPACRVAVRRTAPVGGGGQGRNAGSEAGDHGRADRRPGGDPDRTGARPDPRLADRGIAVLVVSHNLTDVFQVADRIAVVYLGRLARSARRPSTTRRPWSS